MPGALRFERTLYVVPAMTLTYLLELLLMLLQIGVFEIEIKVDGAGNSVRRTIKVNDQD